MTWKWAAIAGGAYVVAGLAAAGYIAKVGDERLSQGKHVFKGGLLSAVLLWPLALASSVGGGK